MSTTHSVKRIVIGALLSGGVVLGGLGLGRGTANAFNPQPDPPGKIRGFDPQPDPPGIIRGFNPQPEPPIVPTVKQGGLS